MICDSATRDERQTPLILSLEAKYLQLANRTPFLAAPSFTCGTITINPLA
jgi:hypothetical protein